LHLGRERAHQVPAVVEPGEGIRDGEPLELRLALPLAQARNQRVEHPRQIPQLTNSAHREFDQEIAGGDLRRGCGEAAKGPAMINPRT